MRTQAFRPSSLATTLVVATLLVPSLALGQAPQPAPPESFAPSSSHRAVVTPTQELEHDGQALLAVASARIEGARMLETAGLQRSASDPRSISDLLTAGSAFYWAGRAERARSVFKTLGSRSEATGNLTAAANAYLMAAWVANQVHATADAAYLVQKVRRLAGSQKLSEQERRGILDRIGDPANVAVQVR